MITRIIRYIRDLTLAKVQTRKKPKFARTATELKYPKTASPESHRPLSEKRKVSVTQVVSRLSECLGEYPY